MNCKDNQSITKPYQYNKQLSFDAKNNISYSNNYYQVLIDSVTELYFFKESKLVLADIVLKRGNTFILKEKVKAIQGFITISFNDDRLYYVKKQIQFFPQEFKGMKYPLFGVVNKKDTYITYYDKTNSKNEMLSLELGTEYLYVLTKDRSYINLKHPSKRFYITGEYCCKLEIIQLDDHLLFQKKYKSRMNQIFRK